MSQTKKRKSKARFVTCPYKALRADGKVRCVKKKQTLKARNAILNNLTEPDTEKYKIHTNLAQWKKDVIRKEIVAYNKKAAKGRKKLLKTHKGKCVPRYRNPPCEGENRHPLNKRHYLKKKDKKGKDCCFIGPKTRKGGSGRPRRKTPGKMVSSLVF